MDLPERIVVGILYPPKWYGSDEGFDAEVAAIEVLDPRIEVTVHTYEESHELRTARGLGSQDLEGLEAPPLEPSDLEAFRRMDVALAIDLPPDVAQKAPQLRWVQALGAGTAHLQAVGVDGDSIRLTSNGGSNSVAIAEFVFARLLEAQKRFPEIADLQAARRWEPVYGRQLSGQTLGLIGYGAINSAVAERAHAFGMTALAVRRNAGDGPSGPLDAVFDRSGLHEMLSRCNAVIAAVPETPETTHMMDAGAFAAMRRGAFFANVGRGNLVDEEALSDALVSGHLRAAAIDVASVEPLPPESPLWETPNLRISAHCSTAPTAMMPNLHRLFLENLERFLEGRPLLNEVTSGRGY